jgi:flagellar basal body-associated protein FliL
MKLLQKRQVGLADNDQIKKRDKHLEISIYALVIIVTVALMLIFFNLFLRG